jgi:mannose-1-phosphate guanylyltransferase
MGDLERRGGIPAAGRPWPTPPRGGQTQVSGVETQAWAVVLAGGKGVRLSGLTRHVYGEDRPKQYAALTGGKSLLRQTLERVSVRIPSSRTVVVTMAAQQSYLAAEFGHDSPGPHVLQQPEDRGTAAAVLLAAHWIRARDSEARLVVLPSDHFVADDGLFMAQVVELLTVLEAQPERIILLGADPTEPEADYGWIELGATLPGVGRHPVYRVLRFQEKPAQAIADQLFGSGALWNTSVFAGRAATLVDAGRACLPSLHDRLARLATFLGTEHERWALRQAYELAPPANFSRAVLERSPQTLAVMRLSAVAWRDLGTPRRVIRTLDELGIHPDWLAALG